MTTKLNYAVFGHGSWATAIVKMLSENLDTIYWYVKRPQLLSYIEKENHNPRYLSSVEFDLTKLKLSHDIDFIADKADVLIFAIPSAYISQELEAISVDISKKIIVSAIKGIVLETGLLVTEHFNKTKNVPISKIAVVGGPCHAEEVALERLSYLTLACKEPNISRKLVSVFRSHYIKTYAHEDIIGVEHAAMLKNIYAIAAGISHGLGYGDNFQSVLMSSAIREMKRFIKKVFKMKRKINETVYLGDLLVTGYSTFSRNRMFGNMIGKGYTVKSAQMEMNMVAEGYYATKIAYKKNKKLPLSARTPIINTVYDILYNKKLPKKAFKELSDKLN